MINVSNKIKLLKYLHNGMAHPLDAVEILGEYVRSMHAKDALWPNRDEGLGIEVSVGKGEVEFPLLISRLKEKGFKGPITIEREISVEQQKKDILEAKKFLQPYLFYKRKVMNKSCLTI